MQSPGLTKISIEFSIVFRASNKTIAEAIPVCRQAGIPPDTGHKETPVKSLITIGMYVLWVAALIGLMVIVFTSFQYIDLNILVLVLFVFAGLNTFLAVKTK